MLQIIANTTVLVKTPQGLAELRARSGTLSLLERRVLILADGTRSVAQLLGMINAPVLELAGRLHGLGFLTPTQSRTPANMAGQPRTPFPVTQPTPLGLVPYATNARDESEDMSWVDELVSVFAEERASGWDDAPDKPARAGTQEFLQANTDTSSPEAGNTQPGMLTHRSATKRGLFYGKAYLIETVNHLLDGEGAWLVQKITRIATEADLYYAFEQMIETISLYANADVVEDIMRRFDEEISRR
jgi:hypothetical protein